MYDYANILFTGNCNMKCYDCIGERDELEELPSNVREYPPLNIDAFFDKVNEHDVPDVAFTGTNVDPQLYRHEKELIEYARDRVDANLSLHTNGLLAAFKMNVVNMYDKVSVSWPSYNPETFAQVVGIPKMPDIDRIIDETEPPLKLSMLATPYNVNEIDEYLQISRDKGISRVVVRKLKGRESEYPLERMEPFVTHEPIKTIFNVPVYAIHDVEVTIWDFTTTSAQGLYLFSDGRIEDRLVEK